jgi:hypothetical protein
MSALWRAMLFRQRFVFGDFQIMQHRRVGQAVVAGKRGHRRAVLALTAAAWLSGCSGVTLNNPFSTTPPPQEDLPTITDRFNQLFGSKKAVEATTADGTELDCPVVKIRAGASTYAVAPSGKQPIASELNYQATITRTARECRRVNSQIVARIGIQGRVIVGPAGAPPSIEVPLRAAVVLAGINEKVITTQVYKTTVSMTAEGGTFSVVGEDLTFTMPQNLTSDAFIFYVGFDPQAVTPAAQSARRK